MQKLELKKSFSPLNVCTYLWHTYMICWRSRSRLYKHTEPIRIQKVESVGHRVVNIWSSEKFKPK